MTLPFHPYADIFPLIEGAEFDAIVADMRENGFRAGEEIVMLDGTILDGRNRYRAAVAAGIFSGDVNPLERWEFIQFSADGIDGLFSEADIERGPLAFVISKNLRRRHLSETQRAGVAARLATMRQGERTDLQPSANLPKVDQAAAADLLNVSERLVRDAKVVIERGAPELARAMDHGKIAASQARQAAELPIATQRKVAEEAEAGRTNAARTVIKQERRAARERELGERQIALPDVVAGVILEDFEWHFAVRSEAGMDRHAANHYETARDALTPEAIIARTAERFACAAPDCVLFQWATIPHLWIALQVMHLRGFDYKSHYAWGKDKIGPGYWNREKHELLLIGTRGSPPAPAMGTQFDSLITAPRGEHSAKPEFFLEMIERWYPTLPKLELNRRGAPRPGWVAWGNEAALAPVSNVSDAVAGLAPDEQIDPATGEIVSVTEMAARVFAEPSSVIEDIPAFLRRQPETRP